MALTKRSARLAAGGLSLALTVAACGGGDTPQGTETTPPVDETSAPPGGEGEGDNPPAPEEKGGTVELLVGSEFEHLDPQRNFVTNSGNFGRLIYRTLTIYKEEPGQPIEVVGDLAEDWKSNKAFTEWTFTLKDGLKYEDGSDITAADLKYGVERSFSPDLSEGAPYARDFLDCPGYKGPYVQNNNGGKGCEAITTPNDKTIVFKLNQPVSEFDFTASLNTFSPVPEAKDTKTEYDQRPFSSGPYKIQSYNRGQSMVLVRNEHWDQATDPVRTALPDKWNLSIGLNPTTIDQRLINDTDPTAMSADTAVQAQSLGRLEQPGIAERAVPGTSQCIRYLSFNFLKPIMRDKALRQAIIYGVNREDYLTARGGPQFGDYVSSVIPESLQGFAPLPEYEIPPTGDPEKAEKFLAQSDYNGETLTMASLNEGQALAASEAMQASLGEIGIEVQLKQLAEDAYYTTVQDDKAAPDLIPAGWCPDWPSASTVIPPIFGEDTSNPGQAGVFNLSRYNDERAGPQNDTWERMDEIRRTIPDPEEAGQAWQELNADIMADAPLLPLISDKFIFVHGSAITHFEISSNFGEPDLIKIGVDPEAAS